MSQSGYLFDGLDLGNEYGIYIEKAKGYMDIPKRKGKTEYDWEDENGVEAFTDADDIHFEARNIILTCHILANSKADFLTKLNAFKTKLTNPGIHTLKLPYKNVLYNVYFREKSALNILTKWNGNKLVSKFYISLREPKPIIIQTFFYIIAPNGGESWEGGSVHNITWNSDMKGNVEIKVSLDGGINWEWITSSTSDDGNFSWEIHSGASENALIKIIDNNGSYISDSVFIILPIYFLDSDGLQFVTSDSENFLVR